MPHKKGRAGHTNLPTDSMMWITVHELHPQGAHRRTREALREGQALC